MCSWDLLSWFANSLDLFQGRTALWDSILILCHKIKVGYGGIVRGMHLGASALSILPVMETESEDWDVQTANYDPFANILHDGFN
jgi:hypothetical protein